MVDRVYPPKYSTDAQARDAHKGTSSTGSPLDDEKPHNIEGDLKIPVKDVNSKDDPNLYYYWVHILEMERDKNDKNKAAKSEESAKMIGSLMEVQCGRMRYDTNMHKFSSVADDSHTQSRSSVLLQVYPSPFYP